MKRFSLELFANAFTLIEVQECFVHLVVAHPNSLKTMVDVLNAVQKDTVNHGRTVWGALLVEDSSLPEGTLNLHASLHNLPQLAHLTASEAILTANLDQLNEIPERFEQYPGDYWTLKVDFG